MGSGGWSTKKYVSYATAMGRSATVDGLTGDYSAQEIFRQNTVDRDLLPYNVTRECRDTEEHPYTVPVILALDVTGSMGLVLVEVAKKLNGVMTELFDRVDDVEIMVMGIGDLAYDRFPLQVSQFESDVRIAEWLDKVFFERGGGGNQYESYTAAWYFAGRHTDLDCWKRGKRGILITIGDEPLNPYLPQKKLEEITGDALQGNVETAGLYDEVKEKYDVYHLAVGGTRAFQTYKKGILDSFGKYLDDNHLRMVDLDSIVPEIVDIVSGGGGETQALGLDDSYNGLISW